MLKARRVEAASAPDPDESELSEAYASVDGWRVQTSRMPESREVREQARHVEVQILTARAMSSPSANAIVP
jgi:hypothetical protein